jgi:hypothetical protein
MTLRAVTNRDSPKLKAALSSLLGIELEYDPSLDPGSPFMAGVFGFLPTVADPKGRITIAFIDGTDDLSGGMIKDRDIIGFNIVRRKLVYVAVPDYVEPLSEECPYRPVDIESYLVAVTLHELCENLTGEVEHCDNPASCINSKCKFYPQGTCCVCMSSMLDGPVKLEDLFCEKHTMMIREALERALAAPIAFLKP